MGDAVAASNELLEALVVPYAPSFSIASGRKQIPSCWQAGSYFWCLRCSASLAACPARQEAVLCQRVNVLRDNARVRDNGLSRVDGMNEEIAMHHVGRIQGGLSALLRRSALLLWHFYLYDSLEQRQRS